MFSKKINKKIAESKRLEEERDLKYQAKITKYQPQKSYAQQEQDDDEEQPEDEPSQNFAPASPRRQIFSASSTSSNRSRSRIAAGFNNPLSSSSIPSNNDSRLYSSSSSNSQRYKTSSSRSPSSRFQPSSNIPDIEEVNEEENILQPSNDEIQEEFDIDTGELQYPTQDYPRGENLLEEYSEELNLSSSPSLRRSKSQQKNKSQSQQQILSQSRNLTEKTQDSSPILIMDRDPEMKRSSSSFTKNNIFSASNSSSKMKGGGRSAEKLAKKNSKSASRKNFISTSQSKGGGGGGGGIEEDPDLLYATSEYNDQQSVIDERSFPNQGVSLSDSGRYVDSRYESGVSNSLISDYDDLQLQPPSSSLPPQQKSSFNNPIMLGSITNMERTSSRLGSRGNSQTSQVERRTSRKSSLTMERERRQMSLERQPSLSIPLPMDNNELFALDQTQLLDDEGGGGVGGGSITNSMFNINNPAYGNPNGSNSNMMNYLDNGRINSNINNPSLTGNQNQASNAASRDVIPLPIEIPDTVTDADAFRRYLSVRRNAMRRGASPFLNTNQNDDDDDVGGGERGTLESNSVGRNRSGTTSQIGSPEILASTTSTRLPPPFQAQSSVHLQQQGPPSESGRSGSGYPDPDLSSPPPSACTGRGRQQDNNASQFLKKTTSLSHAIMTLALLSASAAQLRFVVAYSHAHSYPTLNYFLICSCIIIEVLVGIGFVVLARFEFQDAFVEKMHSYLIFGLFIVTVANVIVAAFALDDHICGEVLKQPAPPPLTPDQQQLQIQQQQQQPLQFDQNQF